MSRNWTHQRNQRNHGIPCRFFNLFKRNSPNQTTQIEYVDAWVHERLNIQFHEKLKKDRTRHRWRIPEWYPLRHWPCLHFSQQNSIAMKVNTLYLDRGEAILIFISQKSVFFLLRYIYWEYRRKSNFKWKSNLVRGISKALHIFFGLRDKSKPFHYVHSIPH